MLTYAIIAAVSYLLGSIPFGYILVKIFLKQDIRATGSGNIGATNVGRTGHKGLAIATLALDAGKGALAVAIAAWLTPSYFVQSMPGQHINLNRPSAQAMAALLAVVGHMYPLWLRFRGGKGVATAAGSFLMISPTSVAIVLATFALAVTATRYVSLGSVLGAIAFPIAFWYLPPRNHAYSRYPYFCYLAATLIGLLVILKHHENIRRLLAGTENRLGAKRTQESA
ncbi:MAG TPA: glycerol-3-phosphate 1-O-acyltransferase PlsY [Terriglobales bacterium]|nr:glycerol-3-phosphate 1-O-acyltransferase PlsY [Terriglobales bacterium]